MKARRNSGFLFEYLFFHQSPPQKNRMGIVFLIHQSPLRETLMGKNEEGIYTLEVYTDDYKMGSKQFEVKWIKKYSEISFRN